MKILAIGETRDVRSGWGRYAHEVTSEYTRRGIDFNLLTSDKLLPITAYNLLPNILRVRRAITRDTTIIHAFDVWPFGVYAAIASIGKGKPLFLTGVGTYSIPPKSGIKLMLMKFAYAKAKETFCISSYTLRRIKDVVNKGNLNVVHWGTTKLPVLSQEKIAGFYNRFGISYVRSPIILTVGQIKHRKGQLDTLKAIKILKSKYPDILYVAVGPTTDADYVKKMHDFAHDHSLENNLMIVDNQKTDEELSFFYSICNIFAMNSNNDGNHFEGFGLVFLEAAQFGKPAVGSKDCGIEDAIVDGGTGYLTEQGDPVDISDKLEKTLSDKEKFGRATKERALEFSWEKTVARYLESYRRYA